MSKYSFMQTPEQRQRAEYYKRKRQVKASNMPLLTDQMVQEEAIETQTDLTQEMAQNDAVFEYATPNMPSTSEVMASFDRGTAGMWAEVGADVTGSIMSITGDLYKASAKKKKDKQRRALEGFRDIELQKIQEKIQQEMAAAAQARASGEAVAPIDINARIKELKLQATFEAGKNLFTIENGSDELSDVIEEALLEKGMEPGTFDSLPLEDRMDILETAFIHEDNPLYNLFGVETNLRKENLWSDLQATSNSVDYGKQSENLKKFRTAIMNSNLQSEGLNDQDSVNAGFVSVFEGSIPLNPEFVSTIFQGNPEEYTTESGTPIFVATRDEEGQLTGLQWNGQVEELLADEKYNDKIGLIMAMQLQQSNPSEYALYFPDRLADSLRNFGTNPDFDIENNPLLSVALPYLAMKNMDTVEDLLSKNKGDGGLGIDVTNRPKLLSTLLIYQSQQEGTRNLTKALNTSDAIYNADNFDASYREVTQLDATGFMSKKGDQIMGSALAALDVINGGETTYEDTYNKYKEEVAFDLADNPSMAILVTTLGNIDKAALPDAQKKVLKETIIENSHITPMFSPVEEGEEGEQAITGFLMHNQVEQALTLLSNGDIQKRINLELGAPQEMRDGDFAAAFDVILKNSLIEEDGLDNFDEWKLSVLEQFEANRILERDALGTALPDYRLSVQQFNETILFMTPSVQEYLLNLEGGSVSDTQTIKDNYEKIIKLNPIVTYKPGTNRAIQQRNEGSYTQSPFGYNVDSISIAKSYGNDIPGFNPTSSNPRKVERETINNIEGAFPSRGSSGIVFPSVYAQAYAEDGDTIEIDPNSLTMRLKDQKVKGLGQSALDILLGKINDTPASDAEPTLSETEYKEQAEKEKQQLTGYWKRWHNMSYMDIVDDVMMDFFQQTLTASNEAIEELPGLLEKAGEDLSKLPEQVTSQARAQAARLPGLIGKSTNKLLGLPGDVVDAVGRELNKRGITSYFINMFSNYARASDNNRMKMAIQESEKMPELAKALEEAVPQGVEVTEEESVQLDNAPLPQTEGSNKTETTKQQQKANKELDFYLNNKIARSRLDPKIKGEIRGLIDTREEMIELIELTKRNSRANNSGNLENRVAASVKKSLDTIPESVDRVLDIPNQVNQKIITPTFLGLYQTLIDLYVRSRN